VAGSSAGEVASNQAVAARTAWAAVVPMAAMMTMVMRPLKTLTVDGARLPAPQVPDTRANNPIDILLHIPTYILYWYTAIHVAANIDINIQGGPN